MNQILNSEPNMNKNNYKMPNRNGSTDKIIRAFAFCMIIFAVGLISSGVYSYMKNQDYTEEIQAQEKTNANITAEEIDNTVKIEVSHDKPIIQLAYSWNGKKENKIQGEGNTLEKIIDLPAGNNTLLIKVTDEDNVETTFEKSFESENGVDIINPEISLEVKESKLVITATDESALDYLTYRWNDDEEKVVKPDEDKTKIQVEVDIMKSSNDITISAVDSNNNTTTETKTFVGVTNPEIVIVLSADGSYLDITCKHERGIKKVEYTLNGQKYEGSFDDSPTDVQFTQDLDVGYNRIILTATSVEGTNYTFDGETSYYPEGYDASAENNNQQTEDENN